MSETTQADIDRLWPEKRRDEWLALSEAAWLEWQGIGEDDE